MLFNILLGNYFTVGDCEQLESKIAFLRGALSRCGHETTVVWDGLCQNGINLYFEHFVTSDLVDHLIQAKADHGLRIGVVAPDLIHDGAIPHGYRRTKLLSPDGIAEQMSERLSGLDRLVAGRAVDFLWSFHGRTAAAFAGRVPHAAVFPFACVEAVPAYLRRASKDTDVVFFGALTPHRLAVLNSLMEAGLSLAVCGRGFRSGPMPRHLLLSSLDRARLGLCIPHEPPGHPAQTTSPLRMMEMLARDLCVVGEETPEDQAFRPYATLVPAGALPAQCKALIDSGAWQALGPERAAAFRRDRDAPRVCAQVIEETLARMGGGPAP